MARAALAGIDVFGGLTLNGEAVSATTSGTWSPALTFATPGDFSVVYESGGIRTGGWEKTGHTVHVSFNLDTVTPTWTTASGRLRVSLPDTVSSLSSRLGVLQNRFKPAGLRLPRDAFNLRWLPIPGEDYAELAYDMPYPVYRCGAYSLTDTFTVQGDNLTWGAWTGRLLWTETALIGGTAPVDQWLYVDTLPTPGAAGWIEGDLAGRGWGILANISTRHTGATEFVTAANLTSGTALILQAGRDGFAV